LGSDGSSSSSSDTETESKRGKGSKKKKPSKKRKSVEEVNKDGCSYVTSLVELCSELIDIFAFNARYQEVTVNDALAYYVGLTNGFLETKHVTYQIGTTSKSKTQLGKCSLLPCTCEMFYCCLEATGHSRYQTEKEGQLLFLPKTSFIIIISSIVLCIIIISTNTNPN
jgi:hypothetical protein